MMMMNRKKERNGTCCRWNSICVYISMHAYQTPNFFAVFLVLQEGALWLRFSFSGTYESFQLRCRTQLKQRNRYDESGTGAVAHKREPSEAACFAFALGFSYATRFIIATTMIYQMPSLSYIHHLFHHIFQMIRWFSFSTAPTITQRNGWRIKHTDKKAQQNFAGELSVCGRACVRARGAQNMAWNIQIFRLLFILYIE